MDRGLDWRTYLVQGMTAFWDDMRLLSGEPEAEAQRLEAHGALLLLVGGILEVCRRLLWRSWESVMNFFWITVTLDEGDDCGCKPGGLLLQRLTAHTYHRLRRLAHVLAIEAPCVP